jgi:hypothetical protein
VTSDKGPNLSVLHPHLRNGKRYKREENKLTFGKENKHVKEIEAEMPW